jgi:hypothetical protein
LVFPKRNTDSAFALNTPFPENLRDPMHAQATAVRLQDLFFILSQCVDLGLLSITAAFRAARDLKKILGCGFEMIRVSQWESAHSVRTANIGGKRSNGRLPLTTEPRLTSRAWQSLAKAPLLVPNHAMPSRELLEGDEVAFNLRKLRLLADGDMA